MSDVKIRSLCALDIFRPCSSSLRCKGKTRALEALEQLPLRTLRCGGRVPRKISNARFRELILRSEKRW